MTTDPWRVDRLDLEGYLGRLGIAAPQPSREALDALHEAHVRTFTFDNIDVLLRQHPGIDLDAVQGKFIGRGRGGYCFEHATIFSAALQRLGYAVRRHLARVGDPAAGTQQGRTHMVVEVDLDGERLLADPGFGFSVLRPIRLADGVEEDYRGWRFRVEQQDRTWRLCRRRDDGWEVMHTIDELPVLPVDLTIGHHYTGSPPGSHFTRTLVIGRHLPGRHVTVTHEAVTVRPEGELTEHRPLRPGELVDWLHLLEVPLSPDEQQRLVARTADMAESARDAGGNKRACL